MKNRIVSFDLLKIIALLGVIYVHVSMIPDVSELRYDNYILELTGACVPIFFILFFYFFNEKNKRIDTKNDVNLEQSSKFWKNVLGNVKRIVIPYIFWYLVGGVLIAIITRCIYFKGVMLSDTVKLKFPSDYIWQFFTGAVAYYNHPMWFSVVLLVSLLFFSVFYKTKYKEKIYAVIVIVCILTQYFFFDEINTLYIDDRIRLSYLRIIELYPYVVTGFYISEYQLLNVIGKKKVTSGVISVCMIICSFLIKDDIGNNLSYGGGKVFLLTLGVFILFYVILGNSKLGCFGNIISNISKYNMGIYSIHWILLFQSYVLKNVFSGFWIFSYNKPLCIIIIYIESLLVCVAMDKIKINRKLFL